MRKPYRTARPNPRLLEPRMVFDAAAAAVATELATDTAPVLDLTRTADATESLLTQQSESLPTAASPTQIAFVDAALLKDGALPGLAAGIELVALQPDADGIAQISAALAGRTEVGAIYLVTHGGAGRLTLGATEIDGSTLADHAARIAGWAPHLSADADILLYGCQVAGADGLALLQSLADLTGADVAASTNNTGPAALGGDWVLEQSTGTIEAAGFAAPAALAQFDALLSVNVSSSSLAGWVAVTPANNQNDAISDQQTGSGSVSQDIVGNNTYRSAYVKYDDGGTAGDLSDDWLAFRVRVNNQDNNQPSSPRFNNFAFFGVDADGDNTVDFFAGVYNPAGNSGRIGVYDANGAGNTGPSDTGIDGTPAFQYDSGTVGYSGLYSVLATGDGSSFSGDADYFVSYQIRIADLNANKAAFGLTADITQNTVLRYIVGTAAQDNAFNQDISGITGAYMSSNLTWAQLGGFTSPIQTNGAVVTSAGADSATADERGGTANGSGGSTPTGNLMTNDAGTGITVTRVQPGATVGPAADAVAAGSTSALNATTVQGGYGWLTVGADGSYSYAVDDTNLDVQALRSSGNTLTETFSYRIADSGSGTADATLTVTIRGANDAPSITSGNTASVPENAPLSTVVYTGTATDVDGGDTKAWSLKAGVGDESLLAINAATGAVTLRAPANAESKSTYSFTIVVTDAGGLTSERSVTLAVANVNEAPLAAADSASATERGGVANGTGGSDAAGNALTNDSDPDNPDSASVTAVAFGGSAGTVGQLLQGSHGTLTLNADGSFSYAIDDTDAAVQALNVGDTLTESFSYTMTDAGGLSSSSTITITLHGANDAPVAPAVPTATVTEGVPMSPIVVPPFTDVDNNVLTCTATLPGGGPLPGWLSFNPVSRTFTGTPPSGSAGTITIRVTGTDGSLTDSVDFSLVVGPPQAPQAPQAADDAATATEAGGVANGTPGSSAAGSLLTNDTGAQLAVSRVQAGSSLGPAATAPGVGGALISGSHGQLTVLADGSFSYAITQGDPAVQALNVGQSLTDVFIYEVTDSTGQTSIALLTVTLAGANDAPVAVAVPAVSVTAGSPIAPLVLPPFTDVDNNVLTYTATLPGGGPLPGWLSFNPVSRTFTGTPPSGSAGTITIRVTGTDGSLADHADILLEIANPPPPPPVQPPSVAPISPLMPPPAAVVIAPPADPEPRAPEPLPITRSTTTVPPVNEVLTPARPAFELTGSPLVTPYELARQQPVADAAPLGDLTTDSRGFRVVVIPSNVQALSVFRGIGDQFVERGSNVKFNLPADAFVHSRPDQIVRLVARQADGRPLPAWLQFDADNGSFSGSPPADFRGELRISIVARDGAGNEAAALFRLNVEEQRASDERSDTLSSRLREAQPFAPAAVALPELPAADAADPAPAADVPPVEAGQGG